MNKTGVYLGIILGIIFVIIGFVYVTHPASALPHFFPGYAAADNRIHLKHAIASFILAVIFFIFAWFQSAPKTA